MLMTLELFCVWEDVEKSGLIEIIPLKYIIAIWGQYSGFLHLDPPQGVPLEMATVADGLVVGNILCLPK